MIWIKIIISILTALLGSTAVILKNHKKLNIIIASIAALMVLFCTIDIIISKIHSNYEKEQISINDFQFVFYYNVLYEGKFDKAKKNYKPDYSKKGMTTLNTYDGPIFVPNEWELLPLSLKFRIHLMSNNEAISSMRADLERYKEPSSVFFNGNDTLQYSILYNQKFIRYMTNSKLQINNLNDLYGKTLLIDVEESFPENFLNWKPKCFLISKNKEFEAEFCESCINDYMKYQMIIPKCPLELDRFNWDNF